MRMLRHAHGMPARCQHGAMSRVLHVCMPHSSQVEAAVQRGRDDHPNDLAICRPKDELLVPVLPCSYMAIPSSMPCLACGLVLHAAMFN